MLTRYSELQDEFRRLEGYSIDLKITTVLRGLGFSRRRLRQAERDVLRRLADAHRARQAAARRARACCCSTSRPTTSTSTRATGSRSTSSDYPHAVILVSHDRFFLDAVVTRITEIGLRTLTDYVGNYCDYLGERDARMERLRQQKRDQDEEIERMQAFINRFRYQATKAAQVQSRIKMLDKIVPIEIPPERKRVRFTFPAVREERPDGARAASDVREGVRRRRACSTTSTCTSSAAIASRSSARTASASRR